MDSFQDIGVWDVWPAISQPDCSGFGIPPARVQQHNYVEAYMLYGKDPDFWSSPAMSKYIHPAVCPEF